MPCTGRSRTNLSVVYLYNPFKGEIFARVLDRFTEAVDRSGRPLRIVYVYPVEHARLAASDRVAEQPPPPRLWVMLAGLSRHVRRYELRPASTPALRVRQRPGKPNGLALLAIAGARSPWCSDRRSRSGTAAIPCGRAQMANGFASGPIEPTIAAPPLG